MPPSPATSVSLPPRTPRGRALIQRVSFKSALAGHLPAMWEIILLGLILMVIGVDLPILVPVGMLVCAAGLVLGVAAKSAGRRRLA